MERFETFTVLMARIGRSIKRIKTEEMARFQLKGPHVSCLYYLSLCKSMTAAQLCERCEEDKAAISRSLEYLEQHEYIDCRQKNGRRYKSPLCLTEKGREVCRTINERIEALVAQASQGLSEAERETMYRSLTLISDNLDHICRAASTGAAMPPEKETDK